MNDSGPETIFVTTGTQRHFNFKHSASHLQPAHTHTPEEYIFGEQIIKYLTLKFIKPLKIQFQYKIMILKHID